MLFLGAGAAFSASLLVGHALGPLVLLLLGGPPQSLLWDPLLIGGALALTGIPLAWLMARGFQMPRRTAGLAVGLVGSLFLWTPLVLTGGLVALADEPWAFPLRVLSALVAGALASAAAWRGLPAEARNPYAVLMDERLPRVVVIGGGFAGLSAVRALAGQPVRITLVDSHNHHLFQPLLYQVATAALSPSSIASPLRRILREQGNVEVLMAQVLGIDLEHKQVLLDGAEPPGTLPHDRLPHDRLPHDRLPHDRLPHDRLPYDRLPYDRLIVAAGSTDFYFGHEAWAEHAPGLKSLGQALHIRNRMLLAFEEAERTTEAALRDALLTFVVVGAGPTGVELAGALSEIARQTLARDFRHIHAASARVVLIEAGPRVLLTFDEGLSRTALRSLQKLGTEVLQSSKVIDIDREGVTIEVGGTTQKIQCRTIIWAAGVRASPLGTMVGGTLDHSGRVLVRPDLTVPDRPEISVIGDLAAATSEGRPVPGLAPAAMQEGKHAARNLLRALENKPTEPFRYRDKGSLATIGRGDAVGQIGKLRFSGLLAWVAWVFVHILYLIGFRNRYVVLTEWAFSYLNHDRGARLITTAGEEDAIHPATHLRSTAAPPTKPDTTLGAPPG